MQKLFYDTRKLDAACRQKYALSEELMMENAASALEEEIKNNEGAHIFILCGSGNNGADGYALARRLAGTFDARVFASGSPKSELCVLQSLRAVNCGVKIQSLEDFEGECTAESNGEKKIIVDCIFGSGFHGDFEGETGALIVRALNVANSMDRKNCTRIACDVPTGLRADGTPAGAVFCADVTVTMGAQKICLYSDYAKDFTGQIKVKNLGVQRELFENALCACTGTSETENSDGASVFLLDSDDMILPFRNKNLVNKGTFGSAYVACGEKAGAALIAASACFKFGAGLVTLINPDENFIQSQRAFFPMELLSSAGFGVRVDALCVGMGLGHNEKAADFYADYLIKNQEVKCVLDADILYSPRIVQILEKRAPDCVLTPHPKEFSVLLKLCGLGEYSVEDCIARRLELVQKFCEKFKGAVLVAKGADSVTGVCARETAKTELYINASGSSALAKGGSGDCLAGMICSLLAQGYDSVNAALSAGLAHGLASKKVKNNFALTPQLLIKNLEDL